MANCSQINNTTIKGTSAVIYDSTPLPCTDIKTCDDLNTILAKFDSVICSAVANVAILKEEVTNITEDVMIIIEDIININNQLNICCPNCNFTGTATELLVCNFTGSANEILNCSFTGTAIQPPVPTTTTTTTIAPTTTTTTTTILNCDLEGNAIITVPPATTTTTTTPIPVSTFCYNGRWDLDDPQHPNGGFVTYINSSGIETTMNNIWLGEPVSIQALSIIDTNGIDLVSCCGSYELFGGVSGRTYSFIDCNTGLPVTKIIPAGDSDIVCHSIPYSPGQYLDDCTSPTTTTSTTTSGCNEYILFGPGVSGEETTVTYIDCAGQPDSRTAIDSQNVPFCASIITGGTGNVSGVGPCSA